MPHEESQSDAISRHFWKVFAIGVAILAYYLITSVAARSLSSTYRPYTVSLESSGKIPAPKVFDRIVDMQSGPAEVTLKGDNRKVSGFVARADDGYLVLYSNHRDQSNGEAVVIPWENVLYIKLMLTASTAK